tara:strand:- start:60 stop:467 length:408 start_codon:yes stop_codon:yes gene_type:complete
MVTVYFDYNVDVNPCILKKNMKEYAPTYHAIYIIGPKNSYLGTIWIGADEFSVIGRKEFSSIMERASNSIGTEIDFNTGNEFVTKLDSKIDAICTYLSDNLLGEKRVVRRSPYMTSHKVVEKLLGVVTKNILSEY